MNVSWNLSNLAILIPCLAACAGASRVELERPLPFRVALLPVEIEETDLSIATPASTGEEKDELRLRLKDEQALTDSILNALRGRGFTDIQGLTYPEDSTVFATKPETDKSKYWMEQADLAQADLLLQVKLFFEPEIASETNEKFWLNLPLFLLGGPFCYFINDRTYTARAKLQAEFFITSSRRSATDDLSAVLPLAMQVEFNGSDLDFTDRAGRSAGMYALSLLVPAGLLARKADRIDERVREKALEDLTSSLLDQIAIQQDWFNRMDHLAAFELDLARTSVRRVPGDQVELTTTVVDNGTGLQQYTVRAGGKILDRGDLSQERTKEHQIVRRVSLPATENFLRLEIGDARDKRRSYTFLVN